MKRERKKKMDKERKIGKHIKLKKKKKKNTCKERKIEFGNSKAKQNL